MENHLHNMKRPMVGATQMEIQAAVELYSLPIYIYISQLQTRGHITSCVTHNGWRVQLDLSKGI